MTEELKIEYVDPAALKPSPGNPRTHPEKQKTALTASLDEFGFVSPAIVNRKTGHVLDGHLRRDVTVERKDGKIPVVFVDWDERKERRFLASFDRIGSLAVVDELELARILKEIEADGGELPPAFDEEEVSRILSQLEIESSQTENGSEEVTEPEEVEIQEDAPARAAVGDTWMLGCHRLLVGDVYQRMAEIQAESVQCVVTSPPYWGLRDYGTARWEGGQSECGHIERTAEQITLGPKLDGLGPGNVAHKSKVRCFRDVCAKCGARRVDAQLGLEETPETHCENMVKVFREVWRVLRMDGTLWVNYGDCFAGGQGKQAFGDMSKRWVEDGSHGAKPIVPPGLKPKDLVGMPWRIAFALQAGGWYLRSDIIWAKGVSFCDSYSGSVMPESVTDRPTSAHEHLFLLTKSARYFYDADAVREKAEFGYRDMPTGNYRMRKKAGMLGDKVGGTTKGGDGGSRNLRNVWTINPQPMPEAHFATFPVKLVTPAVKAGTSEKGKCEKCGAPFSRIIETSGGTVGRSWNVPDHDRIIQGAQAQDPARLDGTYQRKFKGWRPSCKCGMAAEKCTVLDLFAGSGTVMVTCEQLGRASIGIELNPKYADIAIRRWEKLTGKEATKVESQ